MLFIPFHLRGGGLGTLVELAKNEPCETACRMAEGVKRSEHKMSTPCGRTEICDFEEGYIINCHSELRILVRVKR